MSRYTPTTVASLIQVNAELDKIATAIDDTLDRQGTSPNQMKTTLDMNGNPILNVSNLDLSQDEAPIDGNQYAREDGAWSLVEAGGETYKGDWVETSGDNQLVTYRADTELAAEATAAGWVLLESFNPDFVGAQDAISPPIAEDESTSFSSTITVPAGDAIVKLYYNVSSEEGFDFFRVSVDGVEEFLDSGDSGVYEIGVIEGLEAGDRAFTFEYLKDNSTSVGADSVALTAVSTEIAVTSDYNAGDKVTHEGVLYMCYTTGTLEEPSVTAADWQVIITETLDDAPADGLQYARQDNAWTEVVAATGSSAVLGYLPINGQLITSNTDDNFSIPVDFNTGTDRGSDRYASGAGFVDFLDVFADRGAEDLVMYWDFELAVTLTPTVDVATYLTTSPANLLRFTFKLGSTTFTEITQYGSGSWQYDSTGNRLYLNVRTNKPLFFSNADMGSVDDTGVYLGIELVDIENVTSLKLDGSLSYQEGGVTIYEESFQ